MIEQISIPTPEIQFQALAAGTGPLMLLVHGFPDTPHSYRSQLDYFSQQGYRVVAPWLRGYAPSSVPADGDYGVMSVGQDLLNIMDTLDSQQAILVGHDWGAGAVNAAALLAPDRVSHLISSAVPYGPALMQGLTASGDQQRRSWYVFFFLTALADYALPINDFALVKRLWDEWTGPEWLPEGEALTAVLDCFRQPGSVSAALAYYRQTFAAPPPDQYLPIQVPALYIHGEQDGCIGIEFGEPDQSLYGQGCEYRPVPGAGHFVHLEQAGEFNCLVAEFIANG
ncbi:MAG: alpha/beta hydrolase [Immundisolibacteraceae bacterium]|nr:alpha/beta hydrolase [Immundisolibacteraceae bacterium]